MIKVQDIILCKMQHGILIYFLYGTYLLTSLLLIIHAIINPNNTIINGVSLINIGRM